MVTSILAFVVAPQVLRRYRERGGLHLLWWGVGIILYGVGTVTESLTTLFGWQEWVFRSWYISGALLGGAPLAQGTVYLLLPRKVADRLTVVLLSVVAGAAVCVLLTPIAMDRVETYRLSGRVMEWTWVRGFSPFINLYAFCFLVGGAIWSAWYFRGQPENRHRVIGNVFIALGGLLPGIGGSFTRFGHVEVLYVTELVGLILIYIGYRYNIMKPGLSPGAPSGADDPQMTQRTA
jgi:hypothetical protein